MDKIIQRAESISLDKNDIMKICEPYPVKAIAYIELMNANDILDVFGNYDNVIILYRTKKNYGHWVSLLRYQNNIEYFDPYGEAPDYQLHKSVETVTLQGGKPIPKLSYLINDARNRLKYNFVYNTVKLQRFHQDVNTCGRHSALRIKLSHIDLHRYITLMTGQTFDPDMIATYLTYLSLDKDILDLVN